VKLGVLVLALLAVLASPAAGRAERHATPHGGSSQQRPGALVAACSHDNEPAGIEIARALRREPTARRDVRSADRSGLDRRTERRFTRLVGLRGRRLRRHPATLAYRETAPVHGATACGVALPASALPRGESERYARAIVTLAKAIAAT
jgi:hypothetical protein